MITLVIKEVRQLLPILVLWLALMLMSYVSVLLDHRIDELTFAEWCSEACSAGLSAEVMAVAISMIVLLLITAYSLYPREYDESTIDFLNALPVGRTTVFVAKCLAAWLSLCLLLGLSYWVDYLILAQNVQSLDGGNYPHTLLQLAIRDGLFAYVVLGHGVLLSRFRTPGLIVYLMYFLVLLQWERAIGSTGDYNLLEFYRNEYIGSSLQLNWSAIRWHVLVATACYCIAGYLWTRADSAAAGAAKRSRTRWVGILASCIGFFVLALAMLGHMHRSAVFEERAVESTEHYEFLTESGQPALANLLEHADADYRALQSLLESDLTPSIVADLTARKNHVGGLAVWKKIQMDISDHQSDQHYRRVLSHESVHVFQSVLADRVFTRHGNIATFFIEGMAQSVSFRLVPEPERREANWLVAALAHRRHELGFAELSDYGLLEEQYDTELVYTLADVWVEALIERCGISALGQILRSAAELQPPAGLSAERFWRLLLKRSDCELEQVNLAWQQMLDTLLPESADHYPRFGQRVFRSMPSSTIVLEVQLATSDSALPEVDQFYVRIRADRTFSTEPLDVFRGKVMKSGEQSRVVFSLPPGTVNQNPIHYQLGFRPVPDARIFFDRWQRGSSTGAGQDQQDP